MDNKQYSYLIMQTFLTVCMESGIEADIVLEINLLIQFIANY